MIFIKIFEGTDLIYMVIFDSVLKVLKQGSTDVLWHKVEVMTFHDTHRSTGGANLFSFRNARTSSFSTTIKWN